MPNDQPIAYTAEGRPIFDNTPTVVSMIVTNPQGDILAIRRANDPGKGKLGLPGGYHMRGESWQQAGVREVFEETSIILKDSEAVHPMSLVTDEYGNNLIIAFYVYPITQTAAPADGEVLECLWLNGEAVYQHDWAFPRHIQAAVDYFISRE